MEITPNLRTIALIVIGLSYLFMGALIFSAIEKENEVLERKRLFEEERIIKSRYNLSDVEYNNLTKFIQSLEPHRSGIQWEFAGALYFAITVITTIGYGHSVPRTSGGKIFCMAYSVIGIPLCLVMFQAMGERINNAAKYSLKKIGRKLGFQLKEVSHTSLVPVGIFSCCLTVAVGCFSFHYFENWPLLDSLYYCVITLTTIGFGDYVALQTDSHLQFKPSYVAFSFIYILVGLTVIGAFLNLVVLRLMVTTADDVDSTKGEEGNEEVNNNTDVESSQQQRSQHFSNTGQRMVNNNNNLNEENDAWESRSWKDQETHKYGKLSGLPCVSNLYQELEHRNVETRSSETQRNITGYQDLEDCKSCQYCIPISVVLNEVLHCHCNTCVIIKRMHLKTQQNSACEPLTMAVKRQSGYLPNPIETGSNCEELSSHHMHTKHDSCTKTRKYSKPEYTTEVFKHFKFDTNLKLNALEPLHVMSSNSLLSMGSNTSMNDCVDNNLVRHLSVDSGYCGNMDKLKEQKQNDGFNVIQRPSMLNLAKAESSSTSTAPGSFPVTSLLKPEGNLSLPNRIQDSPVLFPSVALSRKAQLLAQGLILQSKASEVDLGTFPSITVTPCSPTQGESRNEAALQSEALVQNVRQRFVENQTQNVCVDVSNIDEDTEDIPTTKLCANGVVEQENTNCVQKTNVTLCNNFANSNIYHHTPNIKSDEEKLPSDFNIEKKNFNGLRRSITRQTKPRDKWGSLHNFFEKFYGPKPDERHICRRTRSFSTKSKTKIDFTRIQNVSDFSDLMIKPMNLEGGDYLPWNTPHSPQPSSHISPKSDFGGAKIFESLPNIFYNESNYSSSLSNINNSSFIRKNNLSL